MTGSSPSTRRTVRLGDGVVWVRDLVGDDERSVSATDSAAARALVDRLLVDAPGAMAGPGQADQLTVAERDLVLAHVHTRTFGDRVSGVGTCAACDEPYDLDFSLLELLEHVGTADARRRVRLPGGAVLRVPTGADEDAVTLAPPGQAGQVLLQRCLEEGELADLDPDEVAVALEAAAPVLDFDATAPCPACGHENVARFDLQAWLLGALMRERSRLFAEIHLLARTYGWSLDSILSLSRPERRMLVALVDSLEPSA